MKKILIFGTGDIGQLAHYYITNDSDTEVVAFCSDGAYVDADEYNGLPLIALEEVLEAYPPDDFGMFVALSYRNLNLTRREKYEEVKGMGYTLPSYICSKSVIWDEDAIGDNCFIFENQTIQPFVTIGNNVTLWSGNHIGHHSTIGDHCFVTSHVVVSGHVDIGHSCFLGVNATIRDGIALAPQTVVGAGATILKPTVEQGVYVGEAAKLRSQKGAKLSYFTKTSYQEKDES